MAASKRMKTMTYTITTDAGLALDFASQQDYEAAEAWYNKQSLEKPDFADFCRKRGVEIIGTDGRMVDDWADIAMHTYATKR